MLTNFRNRIVNLPQWQRTLWIMFFSQVCSSIGFAIIFPFLPLYVEELGTHTNLSIEFWAGMVFSSQAITMMIASPLWGAVADRYGRKMMVQRATFGGAVIIAMMAFVGSAEELVLIRAIQGAITGTVSAANALVAASAPRNRTGYAMGMLQVGTWSGVALGPLIGGVLADAFGYRVPFLVTSALLLVSGVMVHLWVKENFTPVVRSAHHKQSIMGGWGHILAMRGVPQTYVISFFSALTRSMIVPILPLFIVYLVTHGLTQSVVLPLPAMFDGFFQHPAGVSTITGLVIGLSSATATASAVYLGKLGDRIGHRTVLVGCALAGIVFYIPQIYVTEIWQLLTLQALTGLAMGGIIACPSALLALYTEPGEEGAVYGLDNSVNAGARSIAPLVGAGIAAALGLRTTFASATIVFVLIVLVAVVLLPNRRTMPQPQMQLQPAGAD